ncbi:MAG: hypothetical protein ACUVTE_03835 [Candidatus Bathycorpusculaceae bacterium]
MEKDEVGVRSALNQSIKRLLTQNYIRVKDQIAYKIKKKPKTIYALTFKGLLFVLKIGGIEPWQARQTRLKHDIALPYNSHVCAMNLDSNGSFKNVVDAVERNFPDVFYSLLSVINEEAVGLPLPIKNQMRILQVPGAAFMTIYILSQHPDYQAKYLKGQDLYFPDGFVLSNF